MPSTEEEQRAKLLEAEIAKLECILQIKRAELEQLQSRRLQPKRADLEQVVIGPAAMGRLVATPYSQAREEERTQPVGPKRKLLANISDPVDPVCVSKQEELPQYANHLHSPAATTATDNIIALDFAFRWLWQSEVIGAFADPSAGWLAYDVAQTLHRIFHSHQCVGIAKSSSNLSVELVASYLEHSKLIVRRSALLVLRSSGCRQFTGPWKQNVAALLQDDDEGVRKYALGVLYQLQHSSDSTRLIIGALNDSSDVVYCYACYCLRRWQAKLTAEEISQIVVHMHAQHAELRKSIVNFIGCLGSRAVPHMRDMFALPTGRGDGVPKVLAALRQQGVHMPPPEKGRRKTRAKH